MLRFTIADLEGELPVMALSDELSALADTILDVTLVEAMKSVGVGAEKSGPARLRDGDAGESVAGFCVVGYGKLGGKELGYGSDLDIVFLYDESMASRGRAPRARGAAREQLDDHPHPGRRALRDRPAPAARRHQGADGELARRLPRSTR